MVLSLFFTRGISLETWVNKGLFDREKLLYEEHLKHSTFKKIYWFTYGSNDKKISEQLRLVGKLDENIEIFEMPQFFNIPMIGNLLYSFVIPFYYRDIIKKSHILKSNQMDGSWSALISKNLYNIPFINRTGYTLSIFTKKQNVSKLKQFLIENIENIIYCNTDLNVVASYQDKEYLMQKYSNNNINVIPNYIDTDLFKPLNIQKNNRIVFVGRLNVQKNLFNLIKAISRTNLELDIYGEGELKEELIELTIKTNANVNFKGLVDNKELPYILNQYKYYILPSYYEGMPKTLLEAMACGCICIGTDVTGINEVIKNKVNGILIKGTTFENILETINMIISMDCKFLTRNGIKNIINNFSLESVVNKEKKLIDLNV